MEYSGTWKEIWTKKGEMEGSAADIAIYDGWEKSTTGMDETAGRIAEAMDISPDDRVLEVGCGAGGLARYLDCQYVGIDFSRPLTKRCMEFFSLPALHAEANDLPFRDDYFDKCFSWGVFLYFPSLTYAKQVIAEMQRVTKNGNGKIFIGDIPMRSHNERHQTYTKSFFEERGFETMRGWAKPYQDERFNAIAGNNRDSHGA